MLSTADALKILVVCVTIAMALLVLAANARRPSNVAFSAFMLLISGNFLTDFLIAGYPRGSPDQQNWVQASFVFFILDPLALLYFASIFPRRNRLRDARLFSVLGAWAAALLVFDVFVGFGRTYEFTASRAFLFSYMAVSYVIALVGLLITASHEKSPAWRPQSYALAAGLGGALLPRFGLIPVELEFIQGDTVEAWILGAMVVAAVAAIVYAGARAFGGDPDGLRRPYTIAVAFASIFVLGWLLAAVGQLATGATGFFSSYLGIYQYSLRWIVFALIVGVAILRYQVVRFDDRLATPFSYALPLLLVGLIAFLVSQAAATIEAGDLLGFSPPQFAVILALAIGIPLALHWRPRFHQMLRLPGSEDRLAFYRQVLLEAVQNPSEERERMLSELRAVCNVSDDVDQLLRTTLSSGVLPPLAPGALLAGRYRALDVAGRGTATVWRGHDERLDRPVALKPLGPSETPSLEVVALTRVQHPGIIQVYDLVASATGPVLVTEWAEGRSLRDRLKHGRLPATEAVDHARALLGALDAVHAAGIVHGDVKPENILLTASGPKLADFGVARRLESETRLVGPAALKGTPRYLPPEALADGTVDAAADLWATALVLLESLEGPGALDEPPRALRRLSRREPDVARALERALARDPAGRYASASDFLAALVAAPVQGR